MNNPVQVAIEQWAYQMGRDYWWLCLVLLAIVGVALFVRLRTLP